MTLLLVAEDAAPEQLRGHGPALGLHDCLQGHWALLFSNPEDFAPHASTPPGFMMCVADAFHHAQTRPFTVIRRLQQSLDTSWLHQITADLQPGRPTDRSMVVLDCTVRGERVVDLATQALAHKLRRLESPYVVILDEHGRCRSTIAYRARRTDRPRSIEELLCMVTALRGHAKGAASPG